MAYLTLIPHPDRDYKSAKEVRAAWEAGNDFRVCNAFSPDDGRAINKADATPGTTYNIRFKRLTQICPIKVPA